MKVQPPAISSFDIISNPVLDAEKIREVAELTVKLLDKRYPKPARILRGVHPKSHGCVKAKFRINADLSEEYQVGLFSKPDEIYRSWIRYSNASVHVGPDITNGKHGSRGMAIKVLNAGDDILLEDRGRANQDFLMINQPSFAFANLTDYQKLTQVLVENNDDPSLFFAPLIYFKEKGEPPPGVTTGDIQRIGATFAEVQKLQAVPVANPLEVQYFSAAPFLFGKDRVMKFSVRPQGELKPQVVPDNPSDDYLREAVQETIEQGNKIELDFMLQVRSKNEQGLEIENATAVWDEAEIPFVPVATIHIPAPQEVLDSPQGLERCERSVFSPWHSLPEHQPVGSINRLRKEVYLASKVHRGAEDHDNKDRPRGNKAGRDDRQRDKKRH